MKRNYFRAGVFVLLFLFVCSFSVFASGTASETGAAEILPEVRIGLSLGNRREIAVTLQGNYSLIDLSTGGVIELSEQTLIFSYARENAEGKIELNNLALFSGPLLLQEQENEGINKIVLNGITYRGELEIRINPGESFLTAINILDIESYLYGVVPREVSADWAQEGGNAVLEAQAIVARTFALYYRGRHAARGFDLTATQFCQVYGGYSAEHPATTLAVHETKGKVVTYAGRLIPTFYSATIGGYTEASQNVWLHPLPFLETKPDPYDDPLNPRLLAGELTYPWSPFIHPKALWERTHVVAAMRNLPARSGSSTLEESIGATRDIAARHFPSGRVDTVYITGERGTEVLRRERARINLRLPSQMFTVRSNAQVWVKGLQQTVMHNSLEDIPVMTGNGLSKMTFSGNNRAYILGAEGVSTALVRPTEYHFQGQGWGHGVGMSQSGAFNRSKAGHSVAEILGFYFPGTAIVGNYNE